MDKKDILKLLWSIACMFLGMAYGMHVQFQSSKHIVYYRDYSRKLEIRIDSLTTELNKNTHDNTYR